MRYEVWLNGVGLSTLSDKIYIVDVQESTPKFDIDTIGNAKYDGQRMIGRTRRTLSVTVELAVRERNSQRRAEIIEDILAWINDGKLAVSYRHSQYLIVKYVDYPGVGSALRWADNMTVSFTAYDQPYWQAAMPAAVRVACPAGVSTTGMLAPQGTAPGVRLEFEGVATDAVTNVSLSSNDYMLAFTGLDLVAGDVFRGYYDDDGYQRFEVNGESVYGNRTGSDDIILTNKAVNQVTILTNGAMEITLTARGRFL